MSKDWLNFLGWLVQSGAWPTAVVVVAWLFRLEIRSLFARIQKASWGEASAEFGERVHEAEAERHLHVTKDEALNQQAIDPSNTTSAERQLPVLPETSRVNEEKDDLSPYGLRRHTSLESALGTDNLALAMGNGREAVENAWLRLQETIDSIPKARWVGLMGQDNLSATIWSEADRASYVALRDLYRYFKEEEVVPTLKAASSFVRLASGLRERAEGRVHPN